MNRTRPVPRTRRPLSLSLCLAVYVASSAGAIAQSAPPANAPALAPAPAPGASFEFLSLQRAIVQVELASTQVIDARPLGKYLAGHVPGAISVRDEQVREARGSIPAAMLPAGSLGELFGRLGISPERPVLVYADGEDPLPATLVAYALLKAGHPRVRVLDGGFDAWSGSGAVTQEFPTVAPTAWTASPAERIAAELADVRRAQETDEAAFVDARPPKVFRGEGKAWKRNGHIPGAVNLDWQSLVQADNKALLKPAAEIKALLEKSALDSTGETIVYCGTGREATLLYLYLKAAKWPRVRLYEGSWTEYSADSTLAVETGAESRTEIVCDGEMSLAGQPSADQLRELADRGFKLIVNCRTPGEMKRLDYAEPALAASLGMTYVEIPLGGSDGYEPRDVEALDKILREHGGTEGVLMHCTGGGRSANLWAAYLVAHRGLAPSAAMDRVRKTGVIRPTAFERLIDQRLTVEPAK